MRPARHAPPSVVSTRRPLTMAPTSGALRPMSGRTASQLQGDRDEQAAESVPRSARRASAFVRRPAPDVIADPPHGRCECRLDAAHPGGCHGPAAWVIGELYDRFNVCSYCTGPDDMAGAVLLATPDELDAYAAYDALGAHVMRRRAARRAS